MNELAIKTGNHGLVLRNLDEMQRWAEGVQKSGLAPESLKTTAQILVATQYGMELGLSPMAALNSIYVIRNKPTLWGDAALALVRRSGLCGYVTETFEGKGDDRLAKVISKRKDTGEVKTTTFSVADAKIAKLWGKPGSWTTHPDRMLKNRSRAFNLRDNFPDVLMGMYITEELYGEEPLPVPECDTPMREDRRKVESTEIEPEETKEEVEQSTSPLYDEAVARYNELVKDDIPFIEWAAYALCVEKEDVWDFKEDKSKLGKGALTWLLNDMNTKKSVAMSNV